MAGADTRAHASRSIPTRQTRRRCRPRHYPLRMRRAALAFWLPVAAATALCAGLLLPYLSDRVMHRDEALAVMVARRPLGELLETVQLVRGGAPLHFLLVELVGRARRRAAAARLLSALAACSPSSRSRCSAGRSSGRSRASSRPPGVALSPGRALLRRVRAHVLAVPGVHDARAVVPRARARRGRALVGRRRRPARAERLLAPLRRRGRHRRGRRSAGCDRATARRRPGARRCSPAPA